MSRQHSVLSSSSQSRVWVCVSPCIFHLSHSVCGHWITALRSANFLYCLSVAQAFLILCRLPKFIHVCSLSLSLWNLTIYAAVFSLIIVIQWNGEIAAGMKREGGGERCVSVRKTSDPECLHMHLAFKSEHGCWGTVGKTITGAKISESLKDSHIDMFVSKPEHAVIKAQVC